MDDRKAQVVFSMGCRKVAHTLPGASSFFSVSSRGSSPVHCSGPKSAAALGPFHGLVICVTGLSKDARKQVEEATVQLGGQYSSDLHPQCTHLIVQSLGGRKYEHALKHGLKRGLFVVTVAWFVNCVKQNERLHEALYSVKILNNVDVALEELSHMVSISNREHSCLPALPQLEGGTMSLELHPKSAPCFGEPIKQGMLFSGMCFFVDLESSRELKSKVLEAMAKEGATFVDHWFIGSGATHVVCEGSLMLKYLGFNVNLVTPFWVMKSIKEKQVQRLVQLSADLARQVSVMLDAAQKDSFCQESLKERALCEPTNGWNLEGLVQERQEKAKAAKACVCRRRGPNIQPYRTLPRPITPAVLLENVHWTISEPPSSAYVYLENPLEDGLRTEMMDGHVAVGENPMPSDISEHLIGMRTVTESVKEEVVLKTPFLTMLFPIDRFTEIGPASRSFFSEKGFSIQKILELIWTFYQGNMAPDEVELALYSDSKHANKLRAVYADRETINLGYLPIKRYEFLGSLQNFEGLKRSGRNCTNNVYDVCLGA